MSQKLQLLIIEDREDDVELVLRELRRGQLAFDWHRVQNAPDFEKSLNDKHWDVVLSDYSLPSFSALKAIEILMKHSPDIPLIVISGTVGEDTAVETLKAGAKDYIMKDRLARLLPSVQREVLDAASRREKKRMEGALRETVEMLRQSQKMEAIGRLAGGISHDFNNILSIIGFHSEAALANIAKNLHDKARDNVKSILKAQERAAKLTHQLLAFSRKQEIELVSVNITKIVTDMDEMLHRLIGEDIQLEMSLEEAIKPTRADPNQIGQVLMNLVVNARDAMPQGGKIKIRTYNIDLDAKSIPSALKREPGPYVVLSVSDTGSGMDPETRKRIFEPFFTTKDVGQGTGLGLSTVYGIVNHVQGIITVSSEVGQGSIFDVYFPVGEGVHKQVVAPAAENVQQVAGGLILLVEDEVDLREPVAEILREAGYQVMEAQDGMDAIEKLAVSGAKPDLLITDVVMPKMSGRELSDNLHKTLPDLRVLYVSGYTADKLDQQGIADGSIHFVEKPFLNNTLLTKVSSMMSRARS